VLFTLQDGTPGGTEKRVLHVAKGLLERGYEVAVAIPHGGGIGRYLHEAGVPVEEVMFVRMKKSRNPLYYLWWLIAIPITMWEVARIIRKRNIDIVYTNQISQMQPALAAKLKKRKVVWHLIDLHVPVLMDWIFFPLVCVLSDVIVSSCQYRIEQLRNRRLKPRGLIVLHAPVDTNVFRPSSSGVLRSELGIGSDTLLVGMACNINYNKGLEYFLEAAAEIRKHRPDTKFVIIGGPIKTQMQYYQHILDYRASLGLENHVTITGYRDDMPKALADLNIVMFPTLTEASPLAILEAMSCRLPVVVSRVGGVPEIVVDGKTGCLVNPRDSRAFADAVIELIQSPDKMTAMGKAARVRVVKEFDIQVTLDRVEAVIREALKPK
jgi:glycosyltransferase involved in cell wall biosynthesis